MIIAIGAEKAFAELKQTSMIKALKNWPQKQQTPSWEKQNLMALY